MYFSAVSSVENGKVGELGGLIFASRIELVYSPSLWRNGYFTAVFLSIPSPGVIFCAPCTHYSCPTVLQGSYYSPNFVSVKDLGYVPKILVF